MAREAANDVSGSVAGSAVQAGTVRDVHIHAADDRLLAVHQELSRVHGQLVESMRAGHELTRVIWALEWLLGHLQAQVAHLTADRDHRERELDRALAAETRARGRLADAEADRARALRLVGSAMAQVARLEAALTRSGPPRERDAVDLCLDEVDAHLRRQGLRLDRLTAALEPRRSVHDLLRDQLAGPRWRDAAVLLCAVDNADGLSGAELDELIAAMLPRLTAGMGESCAAERVGRSEVLVLCPEVRGAGGLDAMVGAAAAALRGLPPCRDVFARESVSVGVAAPTDTHRSAEALLRQAEAAVGMATARGSGQVCVATRELALLVDDGEGLVGRFGDALGGDRLTLRYRPAFRYPEHRSGRLWFVDVEPLWLSEEFGALAPPRFLSPLAHPDLLARLDLWTVRHGLAVAAGWPEDVSVALRLHRPTARQDEFLSSVAAMIGEAGVSPGRVIFEVEGALSREMEALVRSGARFMVPGFGTQDPSVLAVRDLRAQIVKLERHLVSRVATDRDAKLYVGDLTGTIFAADLEVVAEGVDTGAQWDVLVRTGIDGFQGEHLSGGPMDRDGIEALLRAACR